MTEENKEMTESISVSEQVQKINSSTEIIKQEIKPEAEIQRPQVDMFEILKIVSPGTNLRIALDDILRAETGALIVVMNDKVEALIDGGFKVNCKFTSQRLTELSKMDGAVILSDDLKKIIHANVLLIPNPGIPTVETGTRHKAAERTAKQADTLVIAVSERRKKISLYYGEVRYVLKNAEEILRRATETLQILEKQREIYDDMLTNLNVLEVTGLVSFSDVCNILQRTEMVDRVNDTIRKNIVELGKEGNIIKMRLRELTRNIERTEQLVLRDYATKPERVKELLSEISFDDLLDTEGMSKLLFNRSSNETVQPKGYRILSRTGLSDEETELLVLGFKDLNLIFGASQEELAKVLKSDDYVSKFQKELANLKENIMVGKQL